MSIQTAMAVGSNQLPASWKQVLGELEMGIQREASRQLLQQEERIKHMKSTLALLGPGATLKRGFSITRKNDKAGSRCA